MRLHSASLDFPSPFRTRQRSSHFLGEITAEARDAGAVNTVCWRDGKWIGDNTDVHGVRAALAYAKFDPSGKVAVILGAGGAAKAPVARRKNPRQGTVLSRRDPAETRGYRVQP